VSRDVSVEFDVIARNDGRYITTARFGYWEVNEILERGLVVLYDKTTDTVLY